MKRKKLWASLALGLAAGLGLAGVRLYQKNKKLTDEREAVDLIRAYFSQKGEIGTVYILSYESSQDSFYGGVIMADDRRFVFELEKGRLNYYEEKA